ncbi:unnamed protein product [Rotaria sp. Silwood1]|nr:unnamed protein product [Rotaria sp. Silwood1]
MSGHNNDNNNYVKYPFLSITKLKLSLSRIDENKIIKFLQNMPNLYELIIDISCFNEDHTNRISYGNQWEKIIRHYLPNLQIFRFRMKFNLIDEKNREQRIDELIDSFRSSFWLEEHKWFVRCHWNPNNTFSPIYLYTLPYSFKHFRFNYSMKFKSTTPNDNNYMKYNYVDELDYDTSAVEQIVSSPIQFFNLQNLYVEFPINNHFWSFVPKLDRLTSMVIFMHYYYNIESQLQSLVNHTPCLHSLTFFSSSFMQMMPPLNLRNKSIRRLILRVNNYYFNDKDCMEISHSLLSNQCEILSIPIQNHQISLIILNNMTKLHTLIIACENDKNRENDDEIIIWLKDHLPSTCIISRDQIFKSDIRLWIR